MPENRPLLVATDETVREEVLRLAAAVDCEIEHVPDLAAAGESWASAPVVFVDEGTLAPGEPDLPVRTRTVLVCDGSPQSPTWERAFTTGIGQVAVLPDDEGELVSALADVVEGPGGDDGRVLAVLGARGGAGSSVLAGSVAARAAREGDSALLVDCDHLGGGLDLLLGAEREDGLRWPGLRVHSGRVSMADLRAALPGAPGDSGVDGRLSILSCGRSGTGPAPEAVAAVLDAGRRAGQVAVCDLDRALGPPARVAARKADLVVLVVPAEVRACAAATRVVERLGEYVEHSAIRVVARVPGPDGLGGTDVAEALELPLLSVQRPERGLARALERGEFAARTRGPLAGTARAVLAELHGRCGVAGAR